MSAEKPNNAVQYVLPNGQLTIEGMKYFEKLVAEIRRLAAIVDSEHP